MKRPMGYDMRYEVFVRDWLVEDGLRRVVVMVDELGHFDDDEELVQAAEAEGLRRVLASEEFSGVPDVRAEWVGSTYLYGGGS